MSEDRKLRRGLKDLSPIFNTDSGVDHHLIKHEELSSEKNSSVLLYLTELGGNSVRRDLNFVLAEECKKRSYLYKRIKIKKTSDPLGLSDHHDFAFDSNQEIMWEDFKKGRELKTMIHAKNLEEKSIIFFDLPEAQHEKFVEFVPLLDDWIFLIDVEIDQLTEVYKMIKGTRELNRQINYHLLFKTPRENTSTAFLRNELQNILSKRLQCELSDMGCYQEGPGSHLKCDQIFRRSCEETTEDRLQKKSFIDYLEKHYPSMEQRAV